MKMRPITFSARNTQPADGGVDGGPMPAASMRARRRETLRDPQAFPDSFPFDSSGCPAPAWLGHDTASANAVRVYQQTEEHL